MKDFIIYYSLTLFFYSIEVYLFNEIYPGWAYDVFWLNISLKVVLITIFSILAKELIYKDTKNFYTKYFTLVTLNPLFSSSLLKVFLMANSGFGVLIIKIIADLITSIIQFFILKKIKDFPLKPL